MAHGGFQARGPITAVAAGLHHSHSNTGSELPLQPIPLLTAALDRTPNLMVASHIRFRCTTMGTRHFYYFKLHFYNIFILCIYHNALVQWHMNIIYKPLPIYLNVCMCVCGK